MSLVRCKPGPLTVLAALAGQQLAGQVRVEEQQDAPPAQVSARPRPACRAPVRAAPPPRRGGGAHGGCGPAPARLPSSAGRSRHVPHVQVSEPVKVRPSLPVALTENEPPAAVIAAGTRDTPAIVVTTPVDWRSVTATTAG